MAKQSKRAQPSSSQAIPDRVIPGQTGAAVPAVGASAVGGPTADGSSGGAVPQARRVRASSDEADLRERESLLRAILHSAQDTILVTDTADVVREANQAFRELAALGGWPVQEGPGGIVGRHLKDILPEQDLPIQLSTNALVLKTSSPVHFVQRFAHGSQERWISIVKTPVLDREGACLGVLSMGRDVTAHRNAEHGLRLSEQRLSSILRQVPVGVFETDTEGRVLFANVRLTRLAGRSLAQLKGAPWHRAVHPQEREAVAKAWQQSLDRSGEFTCETRLRASKSGVLWGSCRIRPLRDARGRTTGYLGTLGDVTERKKAEALREDVEHVVRHDLKSPVDAVRNAAKLLEMFGPLNEAQAQVVAELKSVSRRMFDLISLSLDLHAMETGRYTPRPVAVDLCAVLHGLEPELRPLVQGKDLRLDVRVLPSGTEAAGAVPDTCFSVLGERRLLDAIFSNLLKNAAEAAPEGSTISVRLARPPGSPMQPDVSGQPGQAGMAHVALRNLGEVPEAVRERIFEKYATAGKSRGTGLGAYSARLMAGILGGSLEADSSEPGATTLILQLPLA